MRSLPRTLGIVGGVLLLVLIGLAIAVATVDPNQFVGPVLTRIKQATGRDVTVGGGVELRIGLLPRIVANDVRVGNAPWGKAPNLMAAQRIEAQVALFPLLRRQFDLVRLNLIEPVITLEMNRDGRGNWELEAAPGAPTASGAEARRSAVAIGDLTITRGELSYRDGAGGTETRVTIDAVALRARDAHSAVDAEFRGTIDGIALDLSGKLGPLAVLAERSTPYPVAAEGEVADRKVALAVKVRRGDHRVELQDIDVTIGSSHVKGRIEVRDDGAKPVVTVNLTSSVLNVSDLPVLPAAAPVTSRGPAAAPATKPGPAAAPATKSGAAGARSSHYFFTDTAISFEALRTRNVNGEVAIERLVLPGGRTLDRVRVPFTVRDGKLNAPAVQASGYGGTISGALAVDATRGKVPAITVRAEGRDLDLAALLAAAGVAREVRSGKTQVEIDVTMHGDSPRQWMSGINGRARAVIGPATLVNTKLDSALSFDRLAEAVNPFRAASPSTEIQCAVIRVPLAGGIAQIDRSIAMETNQLEVAVSGTLDFRNETLDLSLRPRVRQGIPIEIPQIAGLVRFQGPFSAPAVTVDAVASAAVIARIGAAIGTGGLSILGESIVMQGGPGACVVALGKAAPMAPASTPGDSAKRGSAPSGADDLGKALRELFRR